MRAGVSRVAVEVVILVLAVALALLIFSPVGSFIFSALGRTTSVGGTTQLEVISINPNDGSNNLVITVKNQGPNDLAEAGDTASWSVVIKNSTGEYTVHPSSITQVGGGAVASTADMTVGTAWQFTMNGQGQPATSTFTVIVYGPEGTRAEQIYRP